LQSQIDGIISNDHAERVVNDVYKTRPRLSFKGKPAPLGYKMVNEERSVPSRARFRRDRTQMQGAT
jgi:hypothetical protein